MRTSRTLLLLAMLVAGLLTGHAQDDRQLVRSGNRLYREQNYAKAEVEYRKALGKNARNTQAMYNLGCALMMQQKDSAAVVQLEGAGKAEASGRRKSMAYHNIGVICQRHQMYGEAIEAYKESLRHNPSDNETRYNLALCQRLQKKQGQGGGGGNDKNKDKKDKQQDKQQQKQDKQQQSQKPQPKDQMSKENAEQLLNYAVQEEKATQQRLRQNQRQPQRRRLEKNW